MSDYPNYGEILEVECRIAWPQIGLTDVEIEKRASKRKGKAKNYKDKKTSLTALINKTDKTTLRGIFDAVTDVVGVESVNDVSKWPLVDEDGDLYDGDNDANSDKEGYVGNYFFKTGTNQDIDLAMIDEDGEIVTVSSDDAKKVFYPGSNCLLVLQVCEWDESEVTFYLKGIMRLDDEGQRLGDSFDATGIFQKYTGKKGKKAETKKKGKSKKIAKVIDVVAEEEEEDAVDVVVAEEDAVEVVEPKKKAKKKARKSSRSDISAILN